jgi:hypothetical protein
MDMDEGYTTTSASMAILSFPLAFTSALDAADKGTFFSFLLTITSYASTFAATRSFDTPSNEGGLLARLDRVAEVVDELEFLILP